MSSTILSRLVRRRLALSAQSNHITATSRGRGTCQRRWNTPAPRPGDGPLMSRRADRELPDFNQIRFPWSRTLPVFLALVAAASVAIFNYQKSSSPVIASTLYALRTSPAARSLLGDEIYFRHQIPWIHGEMNQLRGRIDVWFSVRGTKGVGTMRFASRRPTSKGFFETTEWSLTMEDGERIDLLHEAGGIGADPFRGLLGDDGGPLLAAEDFAGDHPVSAAALREEEHVTRGFRQQKTLR